MCRRMADNKLDIGSPFRHCGVFVLTESQLNAWRIEFENLAMEQRQTYGRRAPGAGIDLLATQELSLAYRSQVVSEML